MKQKCSFILKASLSLVLALLMLFGTVANSVAAVVENAPSADDSEGSGDLLKRLNGKLDIAATGAEDDL
ncbi:MAG: hypothetical protein IJI48_01700, partial [Ruminococcus sp.]|nr:hypothetical protein [Ruminococcus sp.]